MTEEEQFYYNLLDDANKDILNTIIAELAKYTDKEVTMLQKLDFDVVEKLLHDDDIVIYTKFKDELNTPYAIMKYLSLYAEEKTICEELIKKLDVITKNNNDIYSYMLRKNFTNEIIFRLKNKKAELKIKYTYDKVENSFNFYLVGHNVDFPIKFNTIQHLLTNDENLIPKSNDLPKINESEDTHVTLTFNGMKITIEKQ